jgi:hypothetical protein
MIVSNKNTGHRYNYSKKQWDRLGNMQKLFNVIDATDENLDQPVGQTVTNTTTPNKNRPNTGEADGKGQTKNSNKSRKK